MGAAWIAAVNWPRRPASSTARAPATTAAPRMLIAARRRAGTRELR
jgi:hypothetical protein